MGQVWRLIPSIAAPGLIQMAIDRWLLEQSVQGLHPPSLRFYTWTPAAISLGYHQRDYPPHWRSLVYQDYPVDLVRRPTGGRAVLHQGDLTYAVVTAVQHRNRLQNYQALCEFLIQGWRSLGLPLRYGEALRGYHQTANCFHLATGADLVLASGAKLIGSAQVYRQHQVLQHGSMQLAPDPALWQQVFGESQYVRPGEAELKRLRTLTPAEIIEALTTAAEICFDMQLHAQPLSPSEWELIHQTLTAP